MEEPKPDAPFFELYDAAVVRDGREILHVERLTLHEGENVAILGPNGSGKSTLVQLLTRDDHPAAFGNGPCARLRGRELWDLLEARALFGVVTSALQERYRRAITVRDTVVSGFFGSIGITAFQKVTPEMGEATRRLLLDLGVEHLAERTMDTLSTGEARRALIARALVHDPTFLVLDEPFAGLDPTARHHFAATIRDLTRGGRGLLLVTHHIEDIPPQVSRVVMLRSGRVFADGPKASLLTTARLSELFAIPAKVEEREGVYRLWV